MVHIQKWGQDLIKRCFQIQGDTPELGFVGSVPYLLVLRWLITLGILLRFALHWKEYFVAQQRLIGALIGIEFLIAIVITFVVANPVQRKKRSIQGAVSVIDIVLISVFYVLTKESQSDFYLFYYLPVFSISEYFGLRAILVITIMITIAFASVLLMFYEQGLEGNISLLDYFTRIFLPREVFFLSAAILSFYLRDIERAQKASLFQRESEIQELLDFRLALDRSFDMERTLALVIDKTYRIKGVNGSHVSLVDYQSNQLMLRKSRPTPYFLEEQYSEAVRGVEQGIIEQQTPLYVEVQTLFPLTSGFQRKTSWLLYVPILTHTTALGVICIGSEKKEYLTKATERFLLGLAGLLANTIERIRLFRALHEIADASASILKLDGELNGILQEITEKHHGDYVSVSLVDNYRQKIEMVRGRNIASGWLQRSNYSLDSTDILADIVRTGKTEVITGWDDRFNREIYERFSHENLSRVFVPLVANGERIGTIEVSSAKHHAQELLTPDNLAAITRIGLERSSIIARTRPHVLLEQICAHALKIVGADSASIHVYRSGTLVRQAGAGRANQKFLKQFMPRFDGLGMEAIRLGQRIVVDKPEALLIRHPALYAEGVKAKGVFPLSIGPDIAGVLYVHFWRDHTFNNAEFELIDVFVRQAEVTIQNHLLLEKITEGVERALTLSGFQNILQSLASGTQLAQVLQDVAQNILYMLDADNITLYQYFEFENEKRFDFPPIMAGSFRNKSQMQTPLEPNDIVWHAIEEGTSFVDDVYADPLLLAKTRSERNKPGFIEREGIKSTAIVVLSAREQEVVGLMFVNYRKPHHFDPEIRQNITTLALSAALAIKTARLYDQVNQALRQRNNERQAVEAVTQTIVGLAKPPHLEAVLSLILDRAMELIGAPVGSVMWYNPWQQILERKAQRGYPNGDYPLTQRIGQGIIGKVAETRISMLAHDVHALGDIYLETIVGTRSELAVPLDDGELLGVLDVQHHEVAAFDEGDKELLAQFARLAVIAIRMANYQDTAIAHQELATLGMAVAAIQHRVGNMLNLIMPALGRLRLRIVQEEVSRQILDDLERHVKYATAITKRLLSPLDHGESTLADIHELLREAVQSCIKRVDQSADINIDFFETNTQEIQPLPKQVGVRQIAIRLEGAADVDGHLVAAQLLEVFQILLENAIKAICDCPAYEVGEIKIQTRKQMSQASSVLEVEISDNGIGIDPSIRHNLFKQPVSRKEPQGAGFGLWISDIIVRSYQGQILLVDAKAGKGTVFLIRLRL